MIPYLVIGDVILNVEILKELHELKKNLNDTLYGIGLLHIFLLMLLLLSFVVFSLYNEGVSELVYVLYMAAFSLYAQGYIASYLAIYDSHFLLLKAFDLCSDQDNPNGSDIYTLSVEIIKSTDIRINNGQLPLARLESCHWSPLAVMIRNHIRDL